MNTITTPEPVFSRDGDTWVPHVEAAGPFRGLHGGAVSGLAVAVMEHMAFTEDFGTPMTASVYILRPAPHEPLTTKVTPLRIGGRIAILESELFAGDKLVAKATAAFVKPISLPELKAVEAPATSVTPETMTKWARTRRADRVTFFDALDIRYWLSGTDLWPPRWGFPNIDVSLHASRARIGEWIGVTPTSDWRVEGSGLTDAVIRDEQGVLGRGCQTVVLTPV